MYLVEEGWVFITHVRVFAGVHICSTGITGAQGGQKRALALLDLKVEWL